MLSKKTQLKNSRLYLILDKEACEGKNMSHILKEALKEGTAIVQYRDKTSSSTIMARNTKKFLTLTRKHRVPLIINDRLDVFLKTDADGIHVGQEDIPAIILRERINKNKIIGLSCHQTDDIERGNEKYIDYLGFGPVFKTRTKPKSQPRGLKTFKKALTRTELPVFAIGGITRKNIHLLPYKRIKRIAVCREVCCAANIKKTVKKLIKILSDV